MARQDRITGPSRESCILKIPDLMIEPSHIPTILSKWNTHNGKLKSQFVDFQPDLMIGGVMEFIGLIRDGIHPAG